MENSLKSELKDMLKDLSKYIDGDWFVGDGALLGLVREKDLIELDNDIDIFLLPNAKLKLPKDCPYGIQKKINLKKEMLGWNISHIKDRVLHLKA